MNYETKRDVFEAVWNRLSEYRVFFNGWPREAIDEYKKRYNAALPDDLPVIPKEVGEWLKNCKHDECDLVDAIVSSVNSIITSRRVTRWMEDHFDTFARAWVLGGWCVEETGEVVKL
ncbi:DUF1642 domain-containing protein [Lacticaseibacillus paracasei]|uniref:DUF1642 domain-containing protein n=1 Tax=Lacticaseibacillus paracasei TaxID=1597 RepID=UPI001EE0D6DE|nr:DUF1642 domain-containing protein [Lacticaseibacillus paracasei]MCG4283834.1 DUF1642 domain-containing protein [Lacticaseibacillus paracasei]